MNLSCAPCTGATASTSAQPGQYRPTDDVASQSFSFQEMPRLPPCAAIRKTRGPATARPAGRPAGTPRRARSAWPARGCASSSRSVVPRAWMSRTMSSTARVALGSRLAVGSSRNRTSGRSAHARASASRCCSPPESTRADRCGERAQADLGQRVVDAVVGLAAVACRRGRARSGCWRRPSGAAAPPAGTPSPGPRAASRTAAPANGARRRRDEPVQQAQQRALARAVGAEHERAGAALDGEVDVAQDARRRRARPRRRRTRSAAPSTRPALSHSARAPIRACYCARGVERAARSRSARRPSASASGRSPLLVSSAIVVVITRVTPSMLPPTIITAPTSAMARPKPASSTVASENRVSHSSVSAALAVPAHRATTTARGTHPTRRRRSAATARR